MRARSTRRSHLLVRFLKSFAITAGSTRSLILLHSAIVALLSSIFESTVPRGIWRCSPSTFSIFRSNSNGLGRVVFVVVGKFVVLLRGVRCKMAKKVRFFCGYLCGLERTMSSRLPHSWTRAKKSCDVHGFDKDKVV